MGRIKMLMTALVAGVGIMMGRGPAVTLEACVDSALALNPAVNAAALEAEQARVMKGTSFNPSMTEVTLKQETTGGGGPENGVYFGQEFDFPTLYVARHRSLTAQATLAERRLSVLMADMEREVAAAYYEAVYTGELLRLNARLGEAYDEFCRVAATRVEAGEAGALELMNAERVREQNRLERGQLELQYENCLLELRRLTGIGEFPALTPFAEVAEPEAPLDFDFAATRLGAAAESGVAVAEREISVARGELLPGVRIGATVQALIKSFNPYHVERLPFEKGNFMGFEVGVTVPLFFGAQTARLKAANLGKRIAMLDMETQRAKAEGEAASLRSRLDSYAPRLAYYRETAIPRADEIRRIAEVSYLLGDIDYIEYIANLETAYSVYRDYAGCVNDRRQTLVNLNTLCR